MKSGVPNADVGRGIRVVLALLAAGAIGGFGSLEGMLYANRKLTVRLAYDVCFSSWSGLTALNDPKNRHLAALLDREMDLSAAKLAEMSGKYPNLIDRSHYNLLVRARDYRKKYGRGTGGSADLIETELDRKIVDAIAHLESIHNTNEWGVPTLDEVIQQPRRAR